MNQKKSFKLKVSKPISFIKVKNLLILRIMNKNSSDYIKIPSSFDISFKEKILILSIDSNSLSLYKNFILELDNLLNEDKIVFFKKLILFGLGYKCLFFDDKRILELKLGYSHSIFLDVPNNLNVKQKRNLLTLESFDKVLLGNFVNKIKSLKKKDSFKGKGF